MTNLYTRWVASVLFPLHECLKGHDTLSVRRKMESSQWLSPEEIDALQAKRLQRLIAYVAEHVPYYRDLLASRELKACDICSVADLHSLPFLTKSLIRENTDRLRSDQAAGLQRFNTGGSSGEPLVFFISKERVSHDVAAKWRATRWWDVDIGDREIVVWGSPIELGIQDHVRLVRDKLLRTELLPAFEMSDQRLNEFISRIRSFRPRMLFGYPSALAHIAAHAEKNGHELNRLGIKVAFVTSERLYDHQKEKIERIFGCPVANGYGGRDAGFIAHQCPAGGMHITAEDIIVEIIDSAGNPVPKGGAGEVVVTHLATRDFPFIRYRTGDVAALSTSSCDCGRSLPMLEKIEGRTTDFVVAQDGTVMHGLALIYVLRDLEEIENFKIVQESLDRCRLLLQVNDCFTADTEAVVIAGMKARLGEDVAIDIQYVDMVPKEKSGKFRYIVSKIGL